MSGTVERDRALSPAPILDAVEHYRGTMIDLDAERTLTADEFAWGREALIAALRRNGLTPGDRVLIAIANGPLFIATLSAVLACDASPLLVHFKTPASEIQRYGERFGAKFLATESSAEADLTAIAVTSNELTFAETYSLRWVSLRVPDFAGPTLYGVPLHPTSGSTGLPKIALRPGFAATEEARHYIETMSIGADDCIAAVPPMSHAYGYGMCVMVPLLSGASIVSTRAFSAKLCERILREMPVTVLPAVPAMLTMFTFGATLDFHKLRWLLTAGAMLPKKVADQFRAKTGTIACPLYGTTETGGISVATAADGQDVDGRVGPPMQGVSVEVRRQEELADAGADVGKLFVKSSSMMHGYLDDQGNILRPADGWFETGDLAHIGSDGVIHLRGRNSEVINVSGMKVVPCEVEEAIAAMSGVKEVKVYGGIHGAGDEFVKVAVAVENGLTAADIRSHCEQHLVYYKRPHIVTVVGALPRTPTGKIIKAELP